MVSQVRVPSLVPLKKYVFKQVGMDCIYGLYNGMDNVGHQKSNVRKITDCYIRHQFTSLRW